jgi:hypothetical protein
MAAIRYSLYCDESGIDAGSPFYFGAIQCSPERANIIKTNILQYREAHDFHREFKWNGFCRNHLDMYKGFVDIFFDQEYPIYILGEFEKTTHWRKLAKNEDSRFIHAYFYFLQEAMLSTSRYAIFLDNKSPKKYKYNQLNFVLNMPCIRSKRQKQVFRFEVVNSHECQIIQLSDVLLGSLDFIGNRYNTTIQNLICKYVYGQFKLRKCQR